MNMSGNIFFHSTWSTREKRMKEFKRSYLRFLLILIIAGISSWAFMPEAEARWRLSEIGSDFAVIAARAEGGGGNVEFMVTDPEGRRIGFDPDTGEYRMEFPGGYERPLVRSAETGEAELVSDPWPGSGGEEAIYTTFAELSLVPGEYTVKVKGTGLTEYDFGVLMSGAGEGRKFHSAGVIDENTAVEYRFTYAPGRGAAEFRKVVTPEGLRRQVELFREKGWLSPAEATHLASVLDDAEGAIGWSGGLAARERLAAFVDEAGSTLDGERAEVLIDDARRIAENLCLTKPVMVASVRLCE